MNISEIKETFHAKINYTKKGKDLLKKKMHKDVALKHEGTIQKNSQINDIYKFDHRTRAKHSVK